MGSNNYGTISEYGGGRSVKQSQKIRQSEGQYEGNVYANNPPRIQKKARPFSAPKGQGLKSVGLKNKVSQSHNSLKKKLRPQTGHGGNDEYLNMNQSNAMVTVNEQS